MVLELDLGKEGTCWYFLKHAERSDTLVIQIDTSWVSASKVSRHQLTIISNSSSALGLQNLAKVKTPDVVIGNTLQNVFNLEVIEIILFVNVM